MANTVTGKEARADYCPIVQVISIKQVGNGGGRYRMILSDGEHYIQGMLATQINGYVERNEVRENAIIRLTSFMVNTIQTKIVIIGFSLEVLESDHGCRIGTPIDVTTVLPPSTGQPGQCQPLYNSTNNAEAVSSSTANSAYQKPAQGSPSGSNPYGRPSSSQQYSAPPIVRSDGVASAITSIASLNMYNNRWTIRARVTSKSDIKTWSNAKGEGSLFSIELLDASGTDIKATFFREAVDKFYGFLEIGKVYRFSGGRLKVANMKWNNCKSDFEITFDQNSEIHLDNDSGDISKQMYEFVKIGDLEHKEPNTTVDILGVVKMVSDPAHLVSKKSGRDLTKCDVTLVDDSNAEIQLTVWGDAAQRAPQQLAGNPVVAFRRCRVSDYGGRSLSAGDGVDVNPDIPETAPLMNWWKTVGVTGATRSLSTSVGGGAGKMASLAERKSIASIKEEGMGMAGSEKADWVSFKATVSFIKKDKEGGAWYTACPNSGEPCKNRYKVTQTTDQQYHCDKCMNTYDNCVRRWIFSGVVLDDFSSTWVSFFNEQAETLLGGATADEVHSKAYGETMEEDVYESYFARALFSEWIFKCKVKSELVNDENRVKTSVVSLHPVDFLKESNDLLAEIEKF